MNIGELLIYCAPLLAITSIYILQTRKNLEYLNISLLSLLGVQTISLSMLVYFFYTTNLEYKYVSDYSAENLSLFYKLSGLWAGRDGTLLIWTWSASLFMIMERRFNFIKIGKKNLQLLYVVF